MGAINTLLTFEEFEKLPDRPCKRELLRGELIELPPAQRRHNQHGRRIFKRMDSAVEHAHAQGESQGLGEAYQGMGYRLGGDGYVQPDVSVSFVAQEREDSEYFQGAPAIAIEVVSPSTMAEELSTKTILYFESGAREVWIVYQKARLLEVHVANASRTVSLDDAVTTPLVPGFSMTVREMLGL